MGAGIARGMGIAGLTLAMALGMASAAVAGPGWEPIGNKTVGANTDTDVIFVNAHRDFRQIQICSFNGPTHMIDVDVYFRNGEHQDIAVRQKLRRGACTRPLDLNGGERHITQIRLRYERVKPRRVPLIRVMGRG